MVTIIRSQTFQHHDDTVTTAYRSESGKANSAGSEWPIRVHNRPLDESFTVIGVHAL